MPNVRQFITAAVLPALMVLTVVRAAFCTDLVYKCVVDGKVNYTSDPAMAGKCPETVIRDDGPSPEELNRILEEKKLRQEEDRKEEEAALKEREVRAKEIEAEAAARRARAAEEELRLLREAPSNPPSDYPYYWGRGYIYPIPPHPPRPPPRPPQPPSPIPPFGTVPMKPTPYNPWPSPGGFGGSGGRR